MSLERTTRFSSAPWHAAASNNRIILIGLGGIGSHLAFQLGRLGKNKFYLYDDDQYEVINMAGQFCRNNDVGAYKTTAARLLMEDFSPDNRVFESKTKFTKETVAGNIMFSGLDNMEGRKEVYHAWKSAYGNKKDAIYIDGRLAATEYQVITLVGGSPTLERYEKEFLFSSEEAEETVCSFKQTSYLAAQIAATMTGIFTNWLTRKADNFSEIAEALYNVPFFYSYNAETLLQTIELE